MAVEAASRHDLIGDEVMFVLTNPTDAFRPALTRPLTDPGSGS